MTADGRPETREEITQVVTSQEFQDDMTGYIYALENYPERLSTDMIRQGLDRKYGVELMEAAMRVYWLRQGNPA